MSRYTCSILIQYEDDKLLSFVSDIIEVLGFTPLYYDIFYDDLKVNERLNLSFDRAKILELFTGSENIRLIKIKGSDDDFSDLNNWFRIILNRSTKENIGETVLLEWSINGNIDFLLESNFFINIINNKSLFYCYCYNQTDAAKQSNTHYNKYGENPKGIKVVTDQFGNKIIDISKNWGKSITVHSLKFVAAPYIWFGLAFENILSLERFKKFEFTNKISDNGVFIKLFNIYESPEQHRKIQRKFWNFIEKNKIIETYEKDNMGND